MANKLWKKESYITHVSDLRFEPLLKAKWSKPIDSPLHSMFNYIEENHWTTNSYPVKEPFANSISVNTLFSGKWTCLSNLTALKVHLAKFSTSTFPNCHKINITKHWHAHIAFFRLRNKHFFGVFCIQLRHTAIDHNTRCRFSSTFIY